MPVQRPRRLLIPGAILILASGGHAWAAEMDDELLVAPIHIDDAGLPRPSLTPGDALRGTKVKAICADVSETRPRLPSTALCEGAFARYGIPPERRFQYACRYLVPLSIGGAGTERNVWPQIEAEAMLKDALDRDLTRRVCAGELSPETAQKAVAYDWIESYRHFLIPDDPKPVVLAPSAATPQLHVRSRPDSAYVMDNDAGGGTPPIAPPAAYPDTPQSGTPGSPSSGGSGQPSNDRRQQRGDRPASGSGARANPPSGAMVPPPRQQPTPMLRAQRQAVVHPRAMARMPRPTRRDRP